MSSTSTTQNTNNTVLIIQHGPRVLPAYVTVFLSSIGQAYEIRDITQKDVTFPDDKTVYKAVISLGGPEGAYEEELYPYLTKEKAYIRHVHKQNIPFLGICLGCQLAASALGGDAVRAAHFEVGYPTLTPTGAGLSDPVLGPFFTIQEHDSTSTSATDTTTANVVKQVLPLLAHHGDTFSVPEGGVLLASTVFPHAWRAGSVYGVQFHPEAAVEDVTMWSVFAAPRYAELGRTASSVIAEAESQRGAALKASQLFFQGWWKHRVLEQQKSTQTQTSGSTEAGTSTSRDTT